MKREEKRQQTKQETIQETNQETIQETNQETIQDFAPKISEYNVPDKFKDFVVHVTENEDNSMPSMMHMVHPDHGFPLDTRFGNMNISEIFQTFTDSMAKKEHYFSDLSTQSDENENVKDRLAELDKE